jgi:hypothetical protein
MFDSRLRRRLSSSLCSERLWGPSSLLYNVSWGVRPRGKGGSGVKMATHLCLMPRVKSDRRCASTPLIKHGVPFLCLACELLGRYGMRKLAQTATLLAWNLEVPCSNLDRDIGCSYRGFRDFPSC